ncbi:uncharacterized protein BXZ73DRAFT_98571 [Epithele typhae]|uniref:uncharacterized protein n=1 Tax=Epithele typhae TaxID=378194 RepID=UPI0020079694|nr:uncharacterized protein BXZ73DRAFT_98571 [Epithele typhae]KAH9940741.1 hypothetical protein BXZ73DRAFT_98571 [Epithele typhae]
MYSPIYHAHQVYSGLTVYSEDNLDLQNRFLANDQLPTQRYPPDHQYNQCYAGPFQPPGPGPLPVRHLPAPYIPYPQAPSKQNPTFFLQSPPQYQQCSAWDGVLQPSYSNTLLETPAPVSPSATHTLYSMAALSLNCAAPPMDIPARPPAPPVSAPRAQEQQQPPQTQPKQKRVYNTPTGLPPLPTFAHNRINARDRKRSSAEARDRAHPYNQQARPSRLSSSSSPSSTSPWSPFSSLPSSPSSHAPSPSSTPSSSPSSPPPDAKLPCPHSPACPARFSRAQEAARHVRSVHRRARLDWACCGLPLALRAPAPGERAYDYAGVAVAGGCGREHSRADAYARHLKRGRCVGDVRGAWMVGARGKARAAAGVGE